MRTRTWVAGVAAAAVAATVGLVGTSQAGADGYHQPGPGVAQAAGVVDLTSVVAGTGYSTTTGWTPTGGSRAAVGTITAPKAGSNACTYASTVTANGATTTTQWTGTGTAFKDVLYPVAVSAASSTTSVTAYPGYYATKASIGVYEGGSSNGACGSIDSLASLSSTKNLQETLALKVAPPGTVTGGRVSEAYLDLNLSSSAVVIASLYRGTTLVGQARLNSGGTEGLSFAGLDSNIQTATCNNLTNSGAQSNNANNCYWHIQPLRAAGYTGGGYSGGGGLLAGSAFTGFDTQWDTISLTTVYGATTGGGGGTAGLQGGQSWAGTGKGGPTRFVVNTTSPKSADCMTADGVTNSSANLAGDFASWTFQRANDVVLQPGDPGYCATKGYGATLNGDKATLIASGDPYGLWYFQLERRYASLDAPPAQLTVDWTNGTTSATGTPIPYCPSTLFDFPSGNGVWSTYDAGTGPVTPPTTYVAPSFSYTTSGPQPPVLKAGAYASLPDGFATTGTKDYVCSYGQSTELVNDGTTSYIRVIDDLYVVGDILVGTKR